MSTPIIIDDIAAIEHLEIPVPAGGGIVILEGLNGTGKSEALKAVQSLVTKRGDISPRDGAVRGEVSAFGATLRVARRLSRSGALEIETLEGKFDIATLVDPKIKDPEAADALRTKALIQLADSSRPDVSLFYDIVGGQEMFEELISVDVGNSTDLVDMSGRVKRDLEKKARLQTEAQTRAELRAETSRRAADGIDTSQPHDAQVLQHELEQTIRAQQALETQSESAKKSCDEFTKAQEQVKAVQDSYKGLSVASADAELINAKAIADDAAKVVDELKTALRAAERKSEIFEATLLTAKHNLKTATEHESQISAFQQIIASGEPEPISEASIALAAENVSSSRLASEKRHPSAQCAQESWRSARIYQASFNSQQRGNAIARRCASHRYCAISCC